ncbi:MAG: META domain-containing protein [Chloroflexi bacterium]|nr:META domain-containing protein [Chloroflexota bacterium]
MAVASGSVSPCLRPALATPAATQTPNPSITFTANPTQIRQGECTTFNWNVVGASAVFFYMQGTAWQSNPAPPSGSQSDCPASTTTYELRVQWADGSAEVRQITIYVESSPDAPIIYRFTVNPAQVEAGQCVTLNWWVEGTINTVQILKDNASLWDGAPVAGNMQDCPQTAGQVTYAISASGPGGTSRQQQIVPVSQQPPNATPTPLPTATPRPNTPTAVPPTATTQPPIINSFVIQPQQIEAGQCIQGSWNVGGGATRARILRNGQAVLDNAPLSGSGTDCLNEGGAYVYRLEASNNLGQQVAEERTVTVSSAVPPLANTNWQLTSYADGSGAMVVPIAGTQLTAAFTNNGHINGNAGCNTYDGLYTVNNSALAINNMAVGRLACMDPAGIMEQEAQYIQLLQRSATYEMGSNQLTIRDAQGQVLLQFQSMGTAVPLPAGG